MRSDKTLRRRYNQINKDFFGNKLSTRVCVRWITPEDRQEEKGCENYYGWARRIYDEPRHDYELVISRSMNIGWIQILATLVHEMCHIATETRDNHGPAFSEWHEILTLRGIFRKGALWKGKTIF
jgi:hypothetical protein